MQYLVALSTAMHLRARKDPVNYKPTTDSRQMANTSGMDSTSKPPKQPKNKKGKKSARGKKAVEEDPDGEDHGMESTWSIAEFRRRYIVLQHKYCDLEKSFVTKVKETSEKHCESVNKVAKEMKTLVSNFKKEVSLFCQKKEAEILALKNSTSQEIAELKMSLDQAREVIVQYESKSVHGVVSVDARPTEKSVMMLADSKTSEHGSHSPLPNSDSHSKPTELSFSNNARQGCEQSAMEIDQETVGVVDLSGKTGEGSSVDRRTSLQTLESWGGLTQPHGVSLRNEWTYDVEQLDCETFAKLKLGPIEERASWGVDLCPEKRYVRCDGDIEISLQAIPHHQDHTPIKSVNQETNQAGPTRNLNFSYSMKKSPIKSRATDVVSSLGEVLSKIQTPNSSLASYRSVNLGILPDLAALGFKCHRVSEHEVIYQHVLTKDAFSLLCEDFDAEHPAEIAYKPIKSHRLRNYLPEYLTEDEIMFEKCEIHKFAQIIGRSVLRCCVEVSAS